MFLSFTVHNNETTTGNVNTFTARAVGTLNASGTYSLTTTYTGISGNQTRGATSLNNSIWFIADHGGIYSNGTSAASRAATVREVKSFDGIVYVSQASSNTAVIAVSTISAATGGTITGLPGLTNQPSLSDFYLVSSGSNGSSFDVLYILNSTSATADSILKYSLVSGTWVANGSYTTTFGGFGLAAIKQAGGANLFVSTGSGATAGNSVIKLNDAAGYNSTINIVTANNVTLYTAAAGTTIKGVSFTPGTVLPINLTSFKGFVSNKQAVLTWQAASEINADHFGVEKSLNGISFSTIATGKASNTDSGSSYAYSDAAYSGLSYYRLKMTDKDGNYTLSSIIKIKEEDVKKVSLKVFPNPSADIITIVYKMVSEEAIVKIVSAEGKIVATKKWQPGSADNTINVRTLARGKYLVIVEGGTNKAVTNFIKL